MDRSASKRSRPLSIPSDRYRYNPNANPNSNRPTDTTSLSLRDLPRSLSIPIPTPSDPNPNRLPKPPLSRRESPISSLHDDLSASDPKLPDLALQLSLSDSSVSDPFPSITIGRLQPRLGSEFVIETNNRREGKRWCFTLNNPAPTDTFNDEHPIDPTLYDYLLCAKETSSTGTPHLQGFIIFNQKRRLSWITSNVFVSTITGKGRASWALCSGTPTENIIYCKKGEQTKEEWLKLKDKGPNYGLNADFVEFGEPPNQGNSKTNSKTFYAEALAKGSVSEALLHLAEFAPRDYALQRQNLVRNFTEHFKPVVLYKPLYPLEDFCHPPLHFSDKHATLVWGDTNLGKTAFVKAHFKNPCFVTHMDNLKSFDRHLHDSIIFDDMSFRHMPAETVIHLLDTDNDASIHIRYGVAFIPARVVKVFTHNTPNPFYNEETVLESHKKAIDRRFKTLHVANKLYK
uniref:Putative replication-associated protein n=1 Tax=Red panda feces-associated crucivirus TaxID=2864022 RepID=A0A8K1HH90_9VIRU|nr:putative replication-associated protein [Red panda feces-associated crucivirus]